MNVRRPGKGMQGSMRSDLCVYVCVALLSSDCVPAHRSPYNWLCYA